MTGLSSEVDVAVIGAGAAGIAAARRLAADSGVSVLVLEARERPGGRAWTVEADGIPMDLGCEWLHSADRNVLAPLAKQLGFGINERRPDWTTRLRYSGESLAAEADWIAEREAFYWAVHRLAQLPEDSPCSAALRRASDRVRHAGGAHRSSRRDAGDRNKSRHGPRETRHHRRAKRDHCRGAARLRPAAPRQAGGGAWATARPCRQTVFPLRGRRGHLRALSDRLDPTARDDELSDPADGAAAHLLLFRWTLCHRARARRL